MGLSITMAFFVHYVCGRFISPKGEGEDAPALQRLPLSSDPKPPNLVIYIFAFAPKPLVDAQCLVTEFNRVFRTVGMGKKSFVFKFLRDVGTQNDRLPILVNIE